ncbi:unnamed protein product [Discosporangium mesarthrocarpum]
MKTLTYALLSLCSAGLKLPMPKGAGNHRAKPPNHFVSLRINNAEIWREVGLVQETILRERPDLMEAAIPVHDLHLTLFVATLSVEDGTLKLAKDTLASCGDLLVDHGLQLETHAASNESYGTMKDEETEGRKNERSSRDLVEAKVGSFEQEGMDISHHGRGHAAMREDTEKSGPANSTLTSSDIGWSGPLRLTFAGLGNFRDQVLYVRLAEDKQAERLGQLVSALYSRFVEAGVIPAVDEGYSFTPHMTIMKMSKIAKSRHGGRGKGGGSRKRNSKGGCIPPNCYDGLGENFGTHIPEALELSSMMEREEVPVPEGFGDEPRSYYACVSRIQLPLGPSVSSISSAEIGACVDHI